MKKKIQLFAKGVFEYEKPEIEISEDNIILEIESGQKYQGVLEIRSKNHVEIRAMIFSSNKWMQCKESAFIGEQGYVHYQFDSSEMEIGDICEGSFNIVSNGGELQIPFKVAICAPYVETSLGRICELDQFVKLAREERSEALEIFVQDSFKSVFLKNKKHEHIYDVIIKNSNKALAMEEFLCAIKRKKTVLISVSQKELEYENLEQPRNDKLVIEKDIWGYTKILVRTSGTGISLSKNVVTEEDFLGNYYQLEFRVDPQKAENAFGSIILETVNQKIEIPVRLSHQVIRREKERIHHSLQSAWLELNCSYGDFLLGKISKAEWEIRGRDAVDGCRNNSDDAVYRVAEAEYLLSIGKKKEADSLIESVNGRELRYQSAIYYSYYLYVSACCKDDVHYKGYVKDTIQFYYERQHPDNWQLLYMITMLDSRSQEHIGRLFRLMKEQYQVQVPGRLFYIQAARMVNAHPELIREMSSFEISLLIWGTRHECFERQTVLHFADMVLRMRTFHEGCLKALMTLCHLYETKNLLSAVLHMLVLGECKQKKYHEWYKLGIDSDIRIQEMYEYFMLTMDMNPDSKIPMSVLIYFQYDNRLPVERKAFLYSYVLKNRSNMSRVFNIYDGIMKAFTMEQLEKGYITENMVQLYQFYLTKETMTTKVMSQMMNVMFKQMLTIETDVSEIIGVVVDYAELQKEIYYPIDEACAAIDLFMDDYQIVFVDSQGSRYLSAVTYTLTTMLDSGDYIRLCADACPENRIVLLNRSERALKYQMMDENSIEVYKRTLQLDDVSRKYQKTILKNLIDYYDDNFEGETLEKYLLQIDIALLGHSERCHVIEYFIQRGLFEKAYEAIMVYGYAGIQDKRLMRLCSKIIRMHDYEKDTNLIEMTYFAFSKGKYDEVILQYLILYYGGTLAQLYKLWEAARNFEVEAVNLEEQIVCQMLFTECRQLQYCEVFEAYYNERPDTKVVKAFLAYMAHQYVVYDWSVPDGIFQIMEIEFRQMVAARDICSLALLKYYAGMPEPEHSKWLYEEASSFIEKGIILPFFAAYTNHAVIPAELIDAVYVSHQTKKEHDVMIHYHLEGKEDFQCESMQHMYGGIFVKSFRLFSGETMIYFISESDGEDETVFEPKNISASKNSADMNTGIDYVNRMIEARDFNDGYTLDEVITGYDQIDAMTDMLFHMK